MVEQAAAAMESFQDDVVAIAYGGRGHRRAFPAGVGLDARERRDGRRKVEKRRRRCNVSFRHPRPVKLSPGRVGFPEPEADEYDLLLIAERDNALADDGDSVVAPGL